MELFIVAAMIILLKMLVTVPVAGFYVSALTVFCLFGWAFYLEVKFLAKQSVNISRFSKAAARVFVGIAVLLLWIEIASAIAIRIVSAESAF